jgi:alcohol dehydrogenase
MIRAAVFDGPGKPFRFEEMPRPVLGDGEALVRIKLCTVCGSDLHTFAGRRGGPTPCVLGHEPVGVIEELNGRVTDVDGQPLTVGDRVVWSVAVSCGTCYFCQANLPQKCVALRKFGHEPHAADGPLGGLATHCRLLSGTAIVKVPDGLPDAVAALAGCAVATVVACGEASGSGDAVVVFGAGMLGLTACAIASGSSAVIACDVSDSRLSLAKRFGATHTSNPSEVVELAKSLTDGRGADAALELSGSSAAAALALDVVRVGGTAVWAGTVSPADAVPVNPEAVVRRCLRIAGVHNYAPWHLRDAVAFLAANHERFPFAELVAKSFPLDGVEEAFRYAEAEKPVRVAVVC